MSSRISIMRAVFFSFFFFQAEDGIRDLTVTGVQTCALPIWPLSSEGVRFFAKAAIVVYLMTVATIFKRLRSEEHTSELQSQSNLVCRLLLEKKKKPRHSEKPPIAT